MIYFILFLTCVFAYSSDDESIRKHYGLSFHNHCSDYVKSFKCMTTCKMMGFQIFRMNFKCKCSCHDMKSTTIVPYFKWRTNGTTKTVPKTQSARLYDIIGIETVTTQGYTGNATCPTFYYPTTPPTDTKSSSSGSNNSTNAGGTGTDTGGGGTTINAPTT
ncbi:PREDICTED: uncharacterized protein LOC106127559 [Papilio xuthus]|uniref:Uncharacterized protein LOC106127559 n=1 Tax=Papilio xuthus TaxID=66420 RepID=A0AAJ6ZXQ1_PAPXU|nr:PREDICTED: uncharacterized protein LOC106127559 [Papilio xuthus]